MPPSARKGQSSLKNRALQSVVHPAEVLQASQEQPQSLGTFLQSENGPGSAPGRREVPVPTWHWKPQAAVVCWCGWSEDSRKMVRVHCCTSPLRIIQEIGYGFGRTHGMWKRGCRSQGSWVGESFLQFLCRRLFPTASTTRPAGWGLSIWEAEAKDLCEGPTTSEGSRPYSGLLDSFQRWDSNVTSGLSLPLRWYLKSPHIPPKSLPSQLFL